MIDVKTLPPSLRWGPEKLGVSSRGGAVGKQPPHVSHKPSPA